MRCMQLHIPPHEHDITFRQERLAGRLQKCHRHSLALLLADHCELAAAALELATRLSGMALADYCALAAKLDEAQVAYPSCFCMKALLHVAHAQHITVIMSADIIDMFVLAERPSTAHNRFKALAPRLQDIEQLAAADLEKALVDGLFSTVLLRLMTVPNGMYAAAAAAEALRDACAAASIMAAAAAVPARPSIMAGPSGAATFVALAAAQWVWIADLQDVACVIICLASFKMSAPATEALLRVQEATSGPRKLLGIALKREPWRKLVSATEPHNIATLAILSKIQDALRVCASDPEAWLKAAVLVPVWKAEVHPGATTELEELLWKVLLVAWDKFDATDQQGSSALLNRLRLARRLMAPNRPDADCIDLMELKAPRPQLFVPTQTCRPNLQQRALLRLQQSPT